MMKEAALDRFPPESDLSRLRASLTEAAAQAQCDLERVKVGAERAEDERGFLARRLDGLVRDKTLMESEDNRRLEILKLVNQDAYKGTIWLRQNLE